MLVISTQNWSILAKFAKKIHRNRLFLLIVSWQRFPPKFPVKSADFSKNLPWKSFEIWLFSAKIPRNRPIFLWILTFLPRKSHEIGRFLSEFWLFSPENPAKSADFSANLPLKIPRNFGFFSAKYQKPWKIIWTHTIMEKHVWIKLHWLWSEISLRAGHQFISPDGKELPNSSKLLWKTKPWGNFECTD